MQQKAYIWWTHPGCCGLVLRAKCCNPSILGRWGRCLVGWAGPGGHLPGPVGTAGGWCELVGQRSSTGRPYRHPSAHHRRPATSAPCTNTDRSPSAGREDGNRTQKKPKGGERESAKKNLQHPCHSLSDWEFPWPAVWEQPQSCKERL